MVCPFRGRSTWAMRYKGVEIFTELKQKMVHCASAALANPVEPLALAKALSVLPA